MPIRAASWRKLANSRNSVILTGFQVPGTRGRALVDGAKQIKIHGRYVPVRAEVHVTNAYSAHADAAACFREALRIDKSAELAVSDPDTFDSESLLGRVQQLVGVVRRLQEPLLQVLLRHRIPAPPALRIPNRAYRPRTADSPMSPAASPAGLDLHAGGQGSDR